MKTKMVNHHVEDAAASDRGATGKSAGAGELDQTARSTSAIFPSCPTNSGRMPSVAVSIAR